MARRARRAPSRMNRRPADTGEGLIQAGRPAGRVWRRNVDAPTRHSAPPIGLVPVWPSRTGPGRHWRSATAGAEPPRNHSRRRVPTAKSRIGRLGDDSSLSSSGAPGQPSASPYSSSPTSPPAMVDDALYVSGSIELLTESTLPSAFTTWMRPGCRLRKFCICEVLVPAGPKASVADG